jgi:catechol 2,3-dioxygenase-like lactoylglutathione lyase family enzyme
MKKLALFKLFVSDQDEALAFYCDKLGFEVSEDKYLGDYRWLLVTLPGTPEVAINLEIAKSDQQKNLVGKQSADLPLFSIETDDCISEYKTMKGRGVEFEAEPDQQPYGIGVMLKDLYGNKIYMNQDVS